MYVYIHIFTYLSVSTPIYQYQYIHVDISVHFRSQCTLPVYFYISLSLYLYPYIICFYIISVGICSATGQAYCVLIFCAILIIFGGFFPHPARATPPLFAGEIWKCRKRWEKSLE